MEKFLKFHKWDFFFVRISGIIYSRFFPFACILLRDFVRILARFSLRLFFPLDYEPIVRKIAMRAQAWLASHTVDSPRDETNRHAVISNTCGERRRQPHPSIDRANALFDRALVPCCRFRNCTTGTDELLLGEANRNFINIYKYPDIHI